MKKMGGMFALVVFFAGLLLIGCGQEVGNPVAPSFDVLDAEELSNEAVSSMDPGPGGEGFYSNSLPFSDQISIGDYTFRVHARQSIDISLLLEDIGETDDSVVIESKLNLKQKALFPGKELVVEVSGGAEKATKRAPRASATLRLVRQIYWWNNVNRRNNFWFARYNSNVATMFINVELGGYKIYYAKGRAWRLKMNVNKTTAAGWLSGSYGLKGFKGVGRYSTNRADIVMFFFK